MFKALFKLIMNLAGTLVQAITFPLNAIINALLPNFSQQLVQAGNVISSIFSGFGWALGLLPPGIVAVLTFVLGMEIAKHYIFIQTHVLIKTWNILQKVKFW